jgi:hypothetical protein
MTSTSDAMASTIHLDLPAPAREAWARAIQTCLACVETCTACSAACLRESDLTMMADCIRTDLDCADLCDTTARVLARANAAELGMTKALLQACLMACESCGSECRKHASHHDHCRVCAEACAECADACRNLLAQLG